MKLIVKMATGILVVGILSSCLDIEEEQNETTLAGEMQQLQTYLVTLEARGDDIDTTDVFIVKMLDINLHNNFI